MRAGAQINHCRSDKSTAAVAEGGERVEGGRAEEALPKIFLPSQRIECMVFYHQIHQLEDFLKDLGKQPPNSNSIASNCTSSTF